MSEEQKLMIKNIEDTTFKQIKNRNKKDMICKDIFKELNIRRMN